MQIFSDESWFPDQTIQTVCFLWWEKQALDALRISLLKHQNAKNIADLKRSKVRAKKWLLQAAMDVCMIIEKRQWKHIGWISVFVWNDVIDLYNQWMELFQNRYNQTHHPITFFPDKNLTLQWHTERHQFSNDKRFLDIVPVTLRTEPLWVIPDLFAWMVREAIQRPAVFSGDPTIITYKPDKYKVMMRQQGSSLLSFFQFYQAW